MRAILTGPLEIGPFRAIPTINRLREPYTRVLIRLGLPTQSNWPDLRPGPDAWCRYIYYLELDPLPSGRVAKLTYPEQERLALALSNS